MKAHSYPVSSSSIDLISFNVNDNLPDHLYPWLVDWLTDYIAGGAEFLDKQTIQFGFWFLSCSLKNRRLHLLAPDGQSLPVHWIDDISVVFSSMAVHKYIPESYDKVMDVPTMTETATVGRFFDELPMFINRMEPVDNGVDSGWFLGSTRDDIDNNDPSQLSVISLYEAFIRAPWIHDFLSMPQNIQVIFKTESPIVLEDFENLKPLPGSYMEALNAKQAG